MARQTITRSQLSEAVYQEVGLSRNESAELLESILSKISETLASEESVKISSFGSFSVRRKGQRIGRNPKTGDKVDVPEKKFVRFKMSKLVRKEINNVKIK